MLKYVENMLKNVKMFNFEKNLNIYINVKIMQNPVSKIAENLNIDRLNSDFFFNLDMSHFRSKMPPNMIYGNFQSSSI